MKIIIMLAIAFNLELSAAARAEDNAIAGLIRQIEDLQKEGKDKEAIPLAEQLVALTRQTQGELNPQTARCIDTLAILYGRNHEHEKAEPLLKEALGIRQKTLGLEDPATAASLTNLAELYEDLSQYNKAEPFYQEALRIRKKVLGPDHPDTATSLNDLALLYVRMGGYAKAEPLYKEALETRTKVLGPEHPDTAISLNNLAGLYFQLGEYPKAEPLFKQALEIDQKVLGPEHSDTAMRLDNLGQLYLRMGEHVKAEPLLEQALEVRKKVFGPEHPFVASSLNALGLLYEDMGQYPKAEPLFKQVLEIRQQALGPDHPDTATALNNLAELYWRMGEYAQAESPYKEALQIRQKMLGRDHPDTATSLNNLAALYYDMGKYAKAEPLFQDALQIDQEKLGPKRLETASDLNNLALLYQRMGEYAKAESRLTEALEIYQKMLGPEHPLMATSLSNLAELYEDMGAYAKAEPLFRQALEIRQKVLGREHPATAISLNNLALLYHVMGDYAQAEPLYKEALDIRQKVLGREHPYTAVSLNNLAGLYEQTGDFAKAEPLFKEALEIRQKTVGPDHPDTASNLNDLALLEFDLGNIEEGKRLATLWYSAQLKAFAQILSFGSEDQRLAYQQLLAPYTLFSALDQSGPRLADTVLHYKGVVLDSIIEDRLLAETSKVEANRQLVEELRFKKRGLAQLLLQATTASPGEAAQRIQSLEEDLDRIQDTLAQQLTDFGQARRALTVTVEQVQAALPKNAVLVEYVRYQHYLAKSRFELRYGAVVFSADAPPRWVTLGSARDIEASLRRYQRLVRKATDEEIAAILQKLYQEVWEPIDQEFPRGANEIIVSPDGQLNFLSFATLLDLNKCFVAEKYSIRYAASGRDLLRDAQPTPSRQIIVMSNPKFDGDIQLASRDLSADRPGALRGAEKREVEDLSFEALTGTQQESAQLLLKFEQWGWPARSLSGLEVNKRTLQNLRSPYILHLATHGFFEPEDASANLNPNEAQSPEAKSDLTRSRFFKNPMHRSGLALAGANTTIEAWKRGEALPIEEDGILTAEDVSTLDLKGTWLVTLSACDTGSGEARAGEGVMGLRRGFIEAGAQNLLMTLWPISDESTVQIMNDFYDAAHQGGNAPEALAKVQREWLIRLRKEQGLANAVNLAGPFIMSSQGRP